MYTRIHLPEQIDLGRTKPSQQRILRYKRKKLESSFREILEKLNFIFVASWIYIKISTFISIKLNKIYILDIT